VIDLRGQRKPIRTHITSTKDPRHILIMYHSLMPISHIYRRLFPAKTSQDSSFRRQNKSPTQVKHYHSITLQIANHVVSHKRTITQTYNSSTPSSLVQCMPCPCPIHRIERKENIERLRRRGRLSKPICLLILGTSSAERNQNMQVIEQQKIPVIKRR